MTPSIYLDNAATTPLDKEVLEAMLPYMTEHFGNPSSTYAYGRTTRMAIEAARKAVATNLGVKPSTITFTSGGTESNNMAILAAIRDLGCNYIITSPIEHHAVLHTVKHYCHNYKIPFYMIALQEDGTLNYEDLESQLAEQVGAGNKCLVSLMHANNETGVLLDMERVGALCHQYKAVFHSDSVQTVGHYPLNLSAIGVHFISGAGHKFHGPKGVGMLYVKEGVSINPLIYGGGQERNMRAGTENVYGIIGFSKALQLSMQYYEKDSAYIKSLKLHMKKRLQETIPGVRFNESPHSLYTVLSVCFPKSEESDFLLLHLDRAGIYVSGGSACSSGANAGSHVMNALRRIEDCTTLRFSFSKYNTKEELDRVVEVLEELLVKKTIMA